jgi:type I site-specific restriction-modification system R (restriction) subunit
VSTGHVVFTTIQKFMPSEDTRNPALSDRRNIIVIADEAHRSQYDFVDGFARHMRDALTTTIITRLLLSRFGRSGSSDRNTTRLPRI